MGSGYLPAAHLNSCRVWIEALHLKIQPTWHQRINTSGWRTKLLLLVAPHAGLQSNRRNEATPSQTRYAWRCRRRNDDCPAPDGYWRHRCPFPTGCLILLECLYFLRTNRQMTGNCLLNSRRNRPIPLKHHIDWHGHFEWWFGNAHHTQTVQELIPALAAVLDFTNVCCYWPTR